MSPPWQLRYHMQYCKPVRMPLRGRRGHVHALQILSAWVAALFLREILVHKVYFLDGEGLTVQVVQTACIGGEAERELVGVERLIFAVKTFVKLAVFAVSEQRMPGVGKLGANLVRSARD